MELESKIAFRLGLNLVQLFGLETFGPEKKQEFEIKCDIVYEHFESLQIAKASKLVKTRVDKLISKRSPDKLLKEYNAMFLAIADILHTKHGNNIIMAYNLGWQIATLGVFCRMASKSELLGNCATIVIDTVSYFEDIFTINLTKSIRLIANKAKKLNPKSQEALSLNNKIMQIVDNISNELSNMEQITGDNDNDNEIKETDNVFVVHGHDNEAKLQVKQLILDLNLNPIVLHEKPNGGKTIIEKFEKNSENVTYAIVIMTPDDTFSDSNGKTIYRARQNVILEWGYFAGILGRNRICILTKQGIENPSDILGVLPVEMDTGGAWKLKIAKEMKSAGMNIDLNNSKI